MKVKIEKTCDVALFATDRSNDDQPADADKIIRNMQDVVTKLHESNIKVIGVTMLPRDWSHYYPSISDEQTLAARQTRDKVNDWIINHSPFDGVVDASEVLKDPEDGLKIDSKYDCDSVYPNTDGYKAVADSINLSLFF